MSDAFSTYFLPPEGTTGDASQFMGQVGGLDIGAQPVYTTTPAAPAQTFTETETGYTPTFDFSAATTPTLPSYGYAAPGYQAPQITPIGPTSFSGTLPSLAITPSFAAPSIPTTTGGIDVGVGAVAPEPTTKTPDQTSFLKSLGISGGELMKMLTGGVGGLLQYQAAQKAQQAAEQARQEYEAAAQKAAEDVKSLAQPYLTAGGSQLSMALQGALSPAQQQQYQAQQAQLAQAAAKSGGIGAIQTAAAEQAMYQQALQAQQNMALQLLGPGNQMAYNAVMTELQGTQGGLQLELSYGQQAAQALGNMMQSIGYGVGAVGTQQQQQQQQK
jgi:hypothetical protein